MLQIKSAVERAVQSSQKCHFRNQCTATAASRGKKIKDNVTNIAEEMVNDDTLFVGLNNLLKS